MLTLNRPPHALIAACLGSHALLFYPYARLPENFRKLNRAAEVVHKPPSPEATLAQHPLLPRTPMSASYVVCAVQPQRNPRISTTLQYHARIWQSPVLPFTPRYPH